MRVLIVKAFGDIKKYDLATTTIEQLEWFERFANDFEVLEYKEDEQ